MLHDHTRLLLETARSVNQAGKPLDMLINRLRECVEAIETELDRMLDAMDSRIRERILQLHGIEADNYSASDGLNDIMSNIFYSDIDIEPCLENFRSELEKIRRKLK
jgi:hypothetical protein